MERRRFAIETESPGMAAVVRLVGELDMADADEVRDVLGAALCREPLVAVDLKDLTFLGSTGLAALLGAHQTALARRSRLVFVSPQPCVVRLLTLTGLNHLNVTHRRAILGVAREPKTAA